MAKPLDQELPLEIELSELSPYAIVAYATRCALRVLPLVKKPYHSAITLEKVLLYCSLVSIKEKEKSFPLINVASPAYTAANAVTKDAANAANAAAYAANAAHAATKAAVRAATNAAAYAYAVADAAKTAFESPINHHNAFLNETRSDFEDLKEISKKSKGFVNRDFYSKPLWTQLDEKEDSGIENVVMEWIETIQSQSQPLVTIRYWHFFDSEQYGEIPWEEIESEVIEWLNELKTNQSTENKNEEPELEESEAELADSKSLNLNADGVPSSLGSGMSDTDLLGRKNLINSLVSMIASSKQDTPFTIGLLGDWGSGKSNVMYLLRKALRERDDKDRFYYADFNAWQYEHTDNMASGVAQEVFKGILSEQTHRQNFRLRWKFGKRENGILLPIILFTVIAVAIFSLVMIFVYDNQGWYAGLGLSAVIISGFIKQIFTILEHPLTSKVNSYLKLPSYAVHLGTIPMLKRHLQTLCDLVIPHDDEDPNRLIVFVDDLDRCEPDAISKTLDAIRLVMDIENVVVIIGIDHRIAFRAVEKQYVELADDERTSSDIARDYLGKIIQLPIILNKPSENDLENFISNSLFKDVGNPHEMENQTESIEKAENSKANTGPDLTFKSNKEKSTFSVAQARARKGKNESDKSHDDEVYQKKGSYNYFSIESKQKDQMEDMTDTDAEKKYFTDLCKLFGMHNPRKLIRLRNCYRILKRIYKPGEHQWMLQMLMLFWLEFTFAQKQKDRIKIEKCLLEKDPNSLAAIIKKREDQPRQIAERLIDEFELEIGNFDIYLKIEEQVKRFVLPHSESANRAKEEEKLETTETREQQKVSNE